MIIKSLRYIIYISISLPFLLQISFTFEDFFDLSIKLIVNSFPSIFCISFVFQDLSGIVLRNRRLNQLILYEFRAILKSCQSLSVLLLEAFFFNRFLCLVIQGVHFFPISRVLSGACLSIISVNLLFQTYHNWLGSQ